MSAAADARADWVAATRRALPPGWLMGAGEAMAYRVHGLLLATVWPTAGYGRWVYRVQLLTSATIVAYGAPANSAAAAFAGGEDALLEIKPPPGGWSETL